VNLFHRVTETINLLSIITQGYANLLHSVTQGCVNLLGSVTKDT
jgi:hypothetical protein